MSRKRSISAMQYMRAHGNSPGPTHRPRVTGALGGLLAAGPSLLIRYFSGALGEEADALGCSLWAAAGFDMAVLVAAGIAYGAIFQRAANDRWGGWLFGISYGFLVWMIGPVTIWQWVTGRPLATGVAAMGIFGAQLIYGLALGALYPLINALVQTRMK